MNRESKMSGTIVVLWSVLALAAVITVSVMVYKAEMPLVVTIRNIGTQDMQKVVVHVTGNKHPVGDIRAGDIAIVDVSPTGDSHVLVEFVDPAGKRLHLVGDCYFGPSFTGSIEVEIEDGKLQSIAERTQIR